MTATHRTGRSSSRVLVTCALMAVLGATGTVAALGAAGGNGQGNKGVGNGNGGSVTTGSSSPGKAFTVAVAATTPVAPGRRGSVTVQVTNPNSQAAVLTSLAGSVTGIGTRGNPRLPACQASWVTLGSWTGAVDVAGGGRTLLTVPVTFTNTPSNQDNCKGVSYTFSFTVNGRQA